MVLLLFFPSSVKNFRLLFVFFGANCFIKIFFESLLFPVRAPKTIFTATTLLSMSSLSFGFSVESDDFDETHVYND